MGRLGIDSAVTRQRSSRHVHRLRLAAARRLRDSGSSGDAARTETSSDSAGSQEATDRYRRYLVEQTELLVDRTRAFVKALNYGNVEQAKRLYPTTRMPYEAVEPVAESFGTLDPDIDAREGDVPAASFRGFHRIEKALWVDNTTKGVRSVAAKLLADIKRLQALVYTIKLEPAQVANGANELLTEVSSSKITGEEERYSHTDLWDFEANVQGSQAAYDSVKPLLAAAGSTAREGDRPALRRGRAKRCEPYRRGDGFVLYNELSEQDKRQLAQSIDALAEPLSQVAADRRPLEQPADDRGARWVHEASPCGRRRSGRRRNRPRRRRLPDRPRDRRGLEPPRRDRSLLRRPTRRGSRPRPRTASTSPPSICTVEAPRRAARAAAGVVRRGRRDDRGRDGRRRQRRAAGAAR